MRCAVKGCKNCNANQASACSFFGFPSNKLLQKEWLKFCRQDEDFNPKTGHVCMEHFTTDDFENSLKYRMGFSKKRALKLGAVPSILQPYRNITASEQNAREVAKELQQYNATLLDNIENNEIMQDSVELQLQNAKKEIRDLRRDYNCQQNEKQILLGELSALKQSNINHLRTIKNLEQRLTRTEYMNNNLEDRLKTIFTEGQISKLKNGVKRPTWTEEDIARSITLYAASAKAYKLLYKNNFPLPAVRTLQKWAQKIDISRGVLQPVVKLLTASSQMGELEKVCVLSFDEMKIRKTYCYDRSSDTTIAPASYVQVAMIRGLMAKWKQPIFYDFDCRMTTEILHNIIKTTADCGYVVAAVVCDLGGGNRALFNELQVDCDKPWFIFNNEKIFVFADVPHLIKLLRNHFLDQGFIINGKSVQKDIILELLTCTSTDLSITHKISDSHLHVVGAQRQKVKMATKLFSHTVSRAITRAASLGHLAGKNWEECFNLFKLTNDWFDIMNVRVPQSDSRQRSHAYGLALDVQDDILERMTGMVKNMRIIGRMSLLPFQRGIIQSNNALKLLYANLKERFDVKYLLTYNLNQDGLENLFGIIRSRGGLHDHPDQQEFKYRMRGYILGHNEGVISQGANVEEDDTPDMDRSDPSLTGIIFSSVGNAAEFSQGAEDEELETLAYDGLENLAGYICHKLRDDLPEIAVDKQADGSFSWVNHLSEGGLSKPTANMMTDIIALQEILISINGDGLLISKDFLKNHIERAENINCNIKVKKLFFRARMYFKIRKLNKEIAETDYKKKRKLVKTIT